MRLRNFSCVLSALGLGVMCLGGAHAWAAPQTWRATLGAQSPDMANQAMAFLPNELWIHAGDNIVWTSGSGEIHTASFLVAGQAFTNFQVGCPGYSAPGASFNGTTCVSTPPLVQGQSYTLKFPTAGNFKLVCLVHPSMTGVIHVLPVSAALPHTQQFYDEQAERQTRQILADPHMRMSQGHDGHDGDHDMDDTMRTRVIAGTGEIASTAAGLQSLSVMRFLKGTIEVRAGDTVEWTNLDPSLPHTITFGTEPQNPVPPSANVTVVADGSLHATIHSTSDSVHSGFLAAAPEDQQGVPQSPPGTTVFRITFTHPGTYHYICALHDTLGMVGKVVVLP